MTKTSPTIIFFGNERLATSVSTTAPVLTSLIAAGYNVAAVVVNYQPAQSRSSKQRQLQVTTVANQHKIPVLSPLKLTEIASQLKSYNATAGVLLAYGKIIPQSIIDIFPRGIINIHPSLLPLHRGSTPIESVILNGERQTGVSLMTLAKQMDAGPVYAQSHLNLTGHETKQELYDELITQGVDLLNQYLPHILDSNLQPTFQDESKATYDDRITKADGQIDWTNSAQQIERQVRAYDEWPKSYTTLGGIDVVITKATVRPIASPATPIGATPIGQVNITKQDGVSNLFVTCGQNTALHIQKLKPAGKSEMDAAGFINGYGKNFS
jgi:methionyl-tRNA formyltransferase